MPSQSPLPAVKATTRPSTPPKMPVLGIPLALTSYDEAMDWLDDRVMARGPSARSATARPPGCTAPI